LNFLNSKNNLLLLHKNMPEPKKAKVYDLVLSPQFYILKKEDLPIKYEFQAKKVAPSILDDLLPNENEYEFIVFKDLGGWNFYAYNPKEIEEFLEKNYNIKPYQIGKIYFADQLNDILKKVPLSLDEENALVLVDKYATIVPKKMLESTGYLKFAPRFRPKRGFWFKKSVKSGAKKVKLQKSALLLSATLAILGILYFIEGISYKKALNKTSEKLNLIYQNHPELQSKLTRDSIKQKYLNIEKSQRKIRELLNSFSQLSSKKSILEKLTLQKDSIEARFKIESNEIKKFKSLLAQTKLKIVNQNGNTITVKGALK